MMIIIIIFIEIIIKSIVDLWRTLIAWGIAYVFTHFGMQSDSRS